MNHRFKLPVSTVRFLHAPPAIAVPSNRSSVQRPPLEVLEEMRETIRAGIAMMWGHLATAGFLTGLSIFVGCVSMMPIVRVPREKPTP